MTKNEYGISWPGWDVIGVIGHGSYGKVYEIQRNVAGYIEKAALKVISIPHDRGEIDELYNDGYDNESITERFDDHRREILREYALMSEIKGHTNIVYCDDHRCIQHDDGMGWDIYIKMELLTPLPKVLGKKIPEELVVKLGLDMCNALILCENQNIIHRDIKPQNIFVSKDGNYKLGDFGIAKTAERTTSGTKTGTYKYMAPEVYNNRPYGHAADIYSLGMVLYWLLNERRTPFLPLPPRVPTSAEEDRARDQRFKGSKIPAPQHGSKELSQVVLKACAFLPENRYKSASEMRDDLLRVTLGTSSESMKEETIPKKRIDAPHKDTARVEKQHSDEDLTIRSEDVQSKDKTIRSENRQEWSRPSHQLKKVLSVAVGCTLILVVITLVFAVGRNHGKPTVQLPPVVTVPSTVTESTVAAVNSATAEPALVTEASAATEPISDTKPSVVTEPTTSRELDNRIPVENILRSDMLGNDPSPWDYGNSPAFGGNVKRNQIRSITFLDNLNDVDDSAWDVSQDGIGAVQAWTVKNGYFYDLYIGAEGGIWAPKKCLGLFAGYINVQEIDFGDAFFTENATDMSYMFYYCQKLKMLDTSGFDTSHVQNMSHMFEGCEHLTSLDVSNFDTSAARNMNCMFNFCAQLKELDVSGFNTLRVLDMANMFCGCYQLTSLDVSHFDTSSVQNMSCMFSSCYKLTELDVSGFNTSRVTDMYCMFGQCEMLTSLDVSHFITSSVQVMSRMFDNCKKLTSLDVSNFDTSKASYMAHMFGGCSGLKQLDLSHFDLSSAKDVSTTDALYWYSA